MTFSYRDMLSIVPQIFELEVMPNVAAEKLKTLAATLEYGIAYHSHKRRTLIVDIDKLADLWTETLVGLCLSHSKEGRDKADFRSDELLGPILTAPVADMRKFAVRLAEKLEADDRVPFVVWSSYRRWVENILSKAEDKGVVQLKTKLAQEVAELVEQQLSPGEWVNAMAGALQWRPADDLQAVKDKIEAGAKPKLTGRQSCLFVEVEDAMVML